MFMCVGTAFANTFSDYIVKHRDAAELQKAISPLLPDGSYITVDNNTLLVSAPAGENKRIIRLIKRLDKPQETLQVSVFRGKYPQKAGVIIATTDTKNNSLQKITMSPGQTVALTSQGLVKVAAMEGAYMGVNSAGSMLNQTHTVTNLKQNATVVAHTKQSQMINLPTGMYIRVHLSGKKQVTVSVKVVSANRVSTIHSASELMALSNSIDAQSIVPIAQWTRLSDRRVFSHQPEVDSQRKVYSTNTEVDSEESLWVRVERMPSISHP
ncbi:hypothetical protein AB835_06460 [Candidatus Endobugula sertula]|uniref:NolW-like domain-containing protein n=1 Tax=Candidatus Endobugula sertula TaxID=62101 RepID=A0A1D2QQJ7_9GAMM|nr:hypothetical protein AB835_06460 [Candidatus Endobugula sertula]